MAANTLSESELRTFLDNALLEAAREAENSGNYAAALSNIAAVLAKDGQSIRAHTLFSLATVGFLGIADVKPLIDGALSALIEQLRLRSMFMFIDDSIMMEALSKEKELRLSDEHINSILQLSRNYVEPQPGEKTTEGIIEAVGSAVGVIYTMGLRCHGLMGEQRINHDVQTLEAVENVWKQFESIYRDVLQREGIRAAQNIATGFYFRLTRLLAEADQEEEARSVKTPIRTHSDK